MIDVKRCGRLAAGLLILASWLPVWADDAPPAPAGTDTTAAAEPAATVNVAELVAQAKAAVKREKFADAQRLYKQALNATPDDVPTLLDYYHVAVKLGAWSDTVSVLEKVFSLDPTKEIEYSNEYGQDLFRLRRYDKAQVALKKAINFGKDADQAHLCLKKIAILQKDPVTAEEEYEAYVKLKPEDFDMQLEYGNFLMKRGKTKEAIARYKAASKAKPTDAALHQTIAYMLLTQKDYDGAIEEYRKCLGAGPTNGAEIQASLKYAMAQKKAAGGGAAKK